MSEPRGRRSADLTGVVEQLEEVEVGATVSFTGGIAKSRMILTIPSSPTGPEQTYVFEPTPANAL
jgi:hypothetical protein